MGARSRGISGPANGHHGNLREQWCRVHRRDDRLGSRSRQRRAASREDHKKRSASVGFGRRRAPRGQGVETAFPDKHRIGSIEILREGRKACIYRLHGAGPSGASVIAKRCRSGSADVEKTIYEEILPCLPISTLNYFGCVDEPETEYRWFFMEDAGSQEYAYSIDEHRKLAARWLGQMHVSAASIPAVSRLPDRGAKHYLNHVQSSRELIQNNLNDPALNSQDLEVLKTVLSRLDLLESRWDRLEEFYDRFPRTLVHCDLGKQNLRVRLRPARNCSRRLRLGNGRLRHPGT